MCVRTRFSFALRTPKKTNLRSGFLSSWQTKVMPVGVNFGVLGGLRL